ncbi:MAG: epimerase [Pedobacter sp.]|nr:MAG: epimerase [Pedobacter sp.]
MQYKVIIVGANEIVGEGVLLKCLESRSIGEVLLVSCWRNAIKHHKLKELIIPDFLELDGYEQELSGYDACFYCSESPLANLDERICSYFMIDMPLCLASLLLMLNPNMVFSYLSKWNSDTTELGNQMMARVTGKAENALAKMIFRKLYFFRVGMVIPLAEQRNKKLKDKIIYSCYPLLKFLMPNRVNTAHELGRAMINSLITKYPEQLVSVKDIRALSTYQQGNVQVHNPLMYMA